MSNQVPTSALSDGTKDAVTKEDFAARIEELDRLIDDFMGRPDLHNSSDENKRKLLKRRNALYSQRKYYRKKLKIERLETERDVFLGKNSKLRKENQIFERMLVCAQEQMQIRNMIESRGSGTFISRDSMVQATRTTNSNMPTTAWELQRSLNGGAMSSGLQELLRAQDGILRKKRPNAFADLPSPKAAKLGNGASPHGGLVLPSAAPGALSAELLRNVMLQQQFATASNHNKPIRSIDDLLNKLEHPQTRSTGQLEQQRLLEAIRRGSAAPQAGALEALLFARHGLSGQF